MAQLEEKVRELQKAKAWVDAEWKKRTASLPDWLAAPFCAVQSRRTVYGRTRFALWRLKR